jgi:hypothetical protein
VLEDLGGHCELTGVHDCVHVLLPAQVSVGALGHQLTLLQPGLQIVLPRGASRELTHRTSYNTVLMAQLTHS